MKSRSKVDSAALVRELLPALQRFARAVAPYQDSADLVQEALARYLAADRSLDSDEALPYLLRTVRNLVVDHARRSWRTVPLTIEPHSHDPTTETDELGPAFHTLSVQDRTLLWLAYVMDLTHRQIAVAIQVKPGSVRVLLSRARQRLRDALIEQEEAHE